MNNEEFLQELINNRTDIPPINPKNGAFYMNNAKNIFVFYDNYWQEVEDFSLNVDQDIENKRISVSESALDIDDLIEDLSKFNINFFKSFDR